MRWWHVALWGLRLSAAPSVHAQDIVALDTDDAVPQPLICIVIRTYWRHGLGEVSLLQRLIDSLKRQTHTRWEAQILVMDSVPFYNLTDILRSNEDDRLWVYGNLCCQPLHTTGKRLSSAAGVIQTRQRTTYTTVNGIKRGWAVYGRRLIRVPIVDPAAVRITGAHHAARMHMEIGEAWRSKSKDGAWEEEYHTLLYHSTDLAARACPIDTQWVLFTNGDNLYHKDAFAEVAAVETADAVAFDFYSRYFRPTGLPCERFQEDGAPPCKVNRMRWCHTDLGAVAYRWSKLVQHDYRFAMMAEPGRFTGQDALMAEAIAKNGWTIVHLEGKCLFDQGPNPAMCARMGGIWDDRYSATAADFGGNCILDADVEEFRNDSAVEVLQIRFANDGSLDGLALYSDVERDMKSIFCLRPAAHFEHMMIPAFGKHCVEDIDHGLYLEYEALKAQGKAQAGRGKEKKAPWMSSSWKRLQVDQPHDEL